MSWFLSQTPSRQTKRQMKGNTSSRVNPWMTSSTSSFGYESTSLISFVKIEKKQHRKSSPSLQVNVVNINPLTKECQT